MSKKSNEPTTNYGIVKITAFWGIIISGFVGLISLVLQILQKCGINLGAVASLVSIFSLIANIALFISVFLAAWAHSKSKGKTMRVLFWVFSVLAFLSILGVNILGII